MFKIFTIVSLLALLSNDGSDSSSSAWGVLLIVLVTLVIGYFMYRGFRRHYCIIRRKTGVPFYKTQKSEYQTQIKNIDSNKVQIKRVKRIGNKKI